MSPEDYAFAVSSNAARWLSPSHQWPRHLAIECLNWELEREIADCDKPPFVVAHRERILKVEALGKPKPGALPALNEATDLVEALQAIQMQPGFPSSTFHAIEIEHGEPLDVTVQRFRNWLTAKDRLTPGAQARRIFHCANGATVSLHRSEPGRKDKAGQLLRAIAVRRLKQSGQTRKQAAEKSLRLRDAVLGRDQWKAFPGDADAAIAKWEQTRQTFSIKSLGVLKIPHQ